MQITTSKNSSTWSIWLQRSIHEQRYVPYLLNVPVLIALMLLFVYPLIYGIMSTFYAHGDWAPAANYLRLINDNMFWHSVTITLLYVVLYTVGIMVIGFVTALAIDINERVRMPGTKWLSSVLTLPYAIPDVVGALVWMWMLNPRQGVINYLLSKVGVSGIGWLVDGDIALLSVLMVEIWRLFPMHTLIILAAFRTVPTDLYEAADIDGASSIQQFFYITLPSVANIMVFLVLLTIVWSFKRFTIMWLLTKGGPMHATETLSIKIYKEAFTFFDRNYAATVAVALLILVAVFSVLYMKRFRRESSGGVL